MNKTFLFLTLILFASVRSGSIFLKLSTIYVTDFHLMKCDSRSTDPVSVENVTIQVGGDNHLHIGGTLSTSEDLISPIKASLTIKKKTWVGWIRIPCEKKIGSCTFDDLCSFGYPPNKECPPNFVENGVPCRCPIKMGTYTLPPSKFALSEEMDVLSGKYKGTVIVSHLGSQLACYNMNFVLKET